MRELEARQNIRENYLALQGGKVVIKPKMRNLLVDWMVDVHTQFSLLQETLYLSVAILDRFLQVKASTLTTKQLQLVGVSAMFVASKYEEMYPPEIGDFVYITDKAYTESQIRKMEITIISSLDFELGRPLPLNFLRRNSKAGFVDAQAHTLAKYVMELSLVEYRMAHVPPSVLAAASLGFAMKVLDSSNASLVDLWTPTLVHYTSYTLEDIASSLMAIADIVQSINTEDDNNAQTESGTSSSSSSSSSKKRLRAVKTKYSSKKFIKIALLPQLRESVTKQMAEGHF
ncbi:G2/mitotic-specific cyclin-B2-like [Tigriopus californicus]|nr:G2/mitotic-specific cyclin-B2-like [Tigriopus californicus]